MRIGRLTLSDRASRGIYADLSGPEIDKLLLAAFCESTSVPGSPPELISHILEDDQTIISNALIELADQRHCNLILTTGGTGPTPRDVTPEATRTVIQKELPGFGEIMRSHSFAKTPTAILSRATAGIRGKSLIINLPGNPKAIGECLPLILPAIRECLKHLQET